MRRRRSVPTMLLPVLLPALTLAACSSGSDVTVPGTPTSSAAATPSDGASSSASASASSVGSAPAASASASGGLVATADALGPARVGQPVSAFAAALGRKVAPPAPGEGGTSCWTLTLSGLPKVTVMVLDRVNGPVRRVDVSSPAVRTAAGVGVGSTQQQVLAAYPGAKVEPHKYVSGAEYLTVSDNGHSLLFETDAKHVVTRYRFGEPEQVSWVEGCS